MCADSNNSVTQAPGVHGQAKKSSEKGRGEKMKMKRQIGPEPSQDSSVVPFCRICHESDSLEELMVPCECRGTLAHTHGSCLERWLDVSNMASCELCGFQFNVTMEPKYGCVRSLCVWLRRQADLGQIRLQALELLILTLLTILGVYICSWTAASIDWERPFAGPAVNTYVATVLLVLVGAILLGYGTWVCKQVLGHARAWRRWRDASMVMRVLPMRAAHVMSQYDSGSGC